eukprot:TRINITY_DN19315_c0_g2_i1.p1 TRINITY_DN19315_c0_g2~~TRINITY_DN19315_c0_g2_i1.p1  ORF type:complete len:483 (+),score=109.66 TRINITY_DN19315_c0_g2_i1:72-1520(+)
MNVIPPPPLKRPKVDDFSALGGHGLLPGLGSMPGLPAAMLGGMPGLPQGMPGLPHVMPPPAVSSGLPPPPPALPLTMQMPGLSLTAPMMGDALSAGLPQLGLPGKAGAPMPGTAPGPGLGLGLGPAPGLALPLVPGTMPGIDPASVPTAGIGGVMAGPADGAALGLQLPPAQTPAPVPMKVNGIPRTAEEKIAALRRHFGVLTVEEQALQSAVKAGGELAGALEAAAANAANAPAPVLDMSKEEDQWLKDTITVPDSLLDEGAMARQKALEEGTAMAQQAMLAQQQQFQMQMRLYQSEINAKSGSTLARFKEGYRPMKLCRLLQESGGCYRGDNCTFAHAWDELHPASKEFTEARKSAALAQQELPSCLNADPPLKMRTKRDMCMRYKSGQCLLEKICPYAHHENELNMVSMVTTEDRVKRIFCKHWENTGRCNFGDWCVNAHGKDQIGKMKPPEEYCGVKKNKKEEEAEQAKGEEQQPRRR